MGIKKKISAHTSRAAWSCHRHSAVLAFGRQNPNFDSFPCFFLLLSQLLEADVCLAWREGAGIKERETEGGMAGAPGAHPAAPGLLPRNTVEMMNSLLIITGILGNFSLSRRV